MKKVISATFITLAATLILTPVAQANAAPDNCRIIVHKSDIVPITVNGATYYVPAVNDVWQCDKIT